MAYNHITSCIPDGQQKSKQQLMLEHGVPAGIIGAVIAFLVSGGSIIAAAAGFGGTIPLAIITGFCDWWFHYRLVCIKDDQCAVGTVGRTDISRGVGDPDLDFTINLVLAPVLKDSLLNAAQQHSLLLPQDRPYFEFAYPDLPLNGVDLKSTAEEGSGDPGTTALHCEIEGTGMKAVCAAATAGAVVGAIGGAAAGAAAVAGCLATGFFFVFCLIVAAIVAALASAAATGVGWLIGVAIGGDEGSPADVAADPQSGTVEAGDHVAIIGDWIYDNAHEGWNELHPVKKLLKLQCPKGTSVPGVDPEYPDSPASRAAIEKYCVTPPGGAAE
ncbi:MAG TPA: hypothetical protein VN890_08715 [Methylocella sp.]|nr:hypothetical protein [Methylocella sp.]